MERGFKILARNFQTRQGEIDIIALKDNIISFVEVKYRKTDKAGLPEEAVSYGKMLKICKCAEYFIYRNKKYASYQMRFDVAAVLKDEIRYYENAFPYVGSGF